MTVVELVPIKEETRLLLEKAGFERASKFCEIDLAAKWLRDVKNLHVCSHPVITNSGLRYYCYFWYKGEFNVKKLREYHKSYEEALEAGIQYACKILTHE